MRMTGMLAVLLLVAPAAVSGQASCPSLCAPALPGALGGPRALSLGGTPLLSADDPEGVFFNPALAEGASGMGLAGQRFGSGGLLASFAGAVEWAEGRVGIALATVSYPTPSLFSPAAALLDGSGSGVASEQTVILGYAREIRSFQVGVGARILDQRVEGGHSTVPSLDLGIAREVGLFVVGASVTGLGPELDTFAAETPQPARGMLGISSSNRPLGPLDVRLTASTDYTRDFGATAGGGVEVSYWPIQGRTFFARAGGRAGEWRDQFSLGGGFAGDEIVIDYGWIRYQGGSSAHVIGLGWR